MTIAKQFPPTAVAVIGMAGRFPDAPDLHTFWSNLTNGVESLTPLTDAELLEAGVPAELIADPNYVKKCTPLEGADTFDAGFFGINAREAELIDPQQRVFLECAWEAIEDAGYVANTYPGSVSVYAGSSYNTYLLNNLMSNPKLMQTVGSFTTMVANDKDYLATRVSYKLNLRGAGITVQSACSTSLVAIQLAWQSLLDYQCDLALAGGVSIFHPQHVGYLYNDGMIFSPDGHCRPFDVNAKGIRAGAGAGVVVLKRLEDAINDRDPIRAVILGAAINNDGADKMGFSAPSIDGQAEVIAVAQARAEVDPGTITYVEAHGTATPLGDPIEVAALSHVFRAGTPKRSFCALGSVKSNLGHLDVAAGVAGLVKTVLALENKTIPPSLNFTAPNPQIDFNDSPFYVNDKLSEWKTDGTPRRAGVSSFGIGGTNSHAVLEEAPPRPPTVSNRPAQLLLLSARSESALEAATKRLADYLKANPNTSLADVAHTLQVGRKRFDYRRVILCHTHEDAIAALEGKAPARVISNTGNPTPDNPPVAFLFSGQGSQYAGMAKHLYAIEPTFREAFDECTTRLSGYIGRDIRELILTPVAEDAVSELNETRYAQPALFAVEYAIAKTWIAWGITPASMLGHSIGEYVAACLAGVMSLDDALRLVAERGRLMQAMPAGRMIAVPLSEAEVAPLLTEALTIAAVNAPQLCVVAGPTAAIEEFETRLAAQNIECRPLHTSHAFHSAMMDPALPDFLKAVENVTLNAPELPYLSNRTGTWATANDVTAPQYWADHLRHTVRFSDGLRELSKTPNIIILEVGPGKTLATLSRQTLGTSGNEILSSLPHPLDTQSDLETMMLALGRLWIAGATVDWQGFHRDEQLYRVSLPTYPFERTRYFVQPNHQESSQYQSISTPANDQHKQRNNDVSSWFYTPSWKRVPSPVDSLTRANITNDGGVWLVFIDNHNVCLRIIDRLATVGATCLAVRAGDSYAANNDREYTVRPGNREDYEKVVHDVVQRHGDIRRVVHGWGITNEKDDTSIDATRDREYFSAIATLQSLFDTHFAVTPSVTFLSTGLQRVVGHETVVPAKGLISGVFAVAINELPHIKCQTIDIILNEVTNELIETLITEATAVDRPQNLAYRSGYRWTESFEHLPIAKHDGIPNRLRPGGVYVITGGLGGIGLLIARFLAQTVQAKLVLIARTAPPDRAEWDSWIASHDVDDPTSRRIEAIQELESLGSELLIVPGDVASRSTMEEAASRATERFGTINGVFHTAGVPGGGTIALHSRQRAREILSAKVEGTVVAGDVFRQFTLDFFVLFSSINATVGFSGTVDYSAANAFMDKYALQHYSSEQPVIAIDWDAWKGVGMMTNFFSAEALKNGILPEEGIEALRRVLDVSVPVVAVITKDYPSLIDRARSGDTSHEIRDAIALPIATDSPVASPVASPIAQPKTPAATLSDHARPNLSQPYAAPSSEYELFIASVWQDLLGISGIGIDDNFFELGGHSLIATGMMARIHQQFQVRLPLRTIFEAPTIRVLGERVATLSWAIRPAPESSSDSSREEFEL